MGPDASVTIRRQIDELYRFPPPARAGDPWPPAGFASDFSRAGFNARPAVDWENRADR